MDATKPYIKSHGRIFEVVAPRGSGRYWLDCAAARISKAHLSYTVGGIGDSLLVRVFNDIDDYVGVSPNGTDEEVIAQLAKLLEGI